MECRRSDSAFRNQASSARRLPKYNASSVHHESFSASFGEPLGLGLSSPSTVSVKQQSHEYLRYTFKVVAYAAILSCMKPSTTTSCPKLSCFVYAQQHMSCTESLFRLSCMGLALGAEFTQGFRWDQLS